MVYIYGKASTNNSFWSTIIVKTKQTETYKGSLIKGSSQRMELMALNEALKHISVPSEVFITTSCDYISNAFNKGWLNHWHKNGWLKWDGKPIANMDLWKQIHRLSKNHTIWVKLEQNLDNSKYLLDCKTLVEGS